MTMRVVSALLFLFVLQIAAPAARAEEPVDLELVLAVDVSRSVDLAEAELQRQGYAGAFRDPEVIRAIEQGILGRIAVTYIEWAGIFHAETVIGWTLIDGRDSALAFADAVERIPYRAERRTSISNAIDYAVPLFDRNGFQGTRLAIDVSGDGPNNDGGLVNLARDRAVAAGITINGLPILDDSGGFYGWYNIPNLDLYYRDCVIGGPGALMVVAANFQDFARAIRRKLILEIAGEPPRLVPAQFNLKNGEAPPCNIGELLRKAREEEDY